jgi:hypothetical protein
MTLRLGGLCQWSTVKCNAPRALQRIYYDAVRVRVIPTGAQTRWQYTSADAIDAHSSEPTTSHVYKPLTSVSGRSNTIRLLRILPVSSTSPSTIHCKIDRFSLGESLVYSAVFYVWGSVAELKTLVVNNQRMAVRPNIWHFLHQLREEQHDGLLWVDAICINQDDVEERSQQVAIMGQIYSGAEDVKVWLGYRDERIPRLLEKVQTSEWPKAKEVIDAATSSNEGFYYRRLFEDLREVSELEYWKRLWIVEEFFLAQRIELRYGASRVEAQKLRQALGRVKAFQQTTPADDAYGFLTLSDLDVSLTRRVPMAPLGPEGSSDSNLETLADDIINSPMVVIFTARDYYQGWGSEWAAFNFPALVARYAASLCLDARDHVYALLPLADGATVPLDIVPDYRRSAIEIFEHVVGLQIRSFRLVAAIEEPPSAARDFVYETALSIRRALGLDGEDERIKAILGTLEEAVRLAADED